MIFLKVFYKKIKRDDVNLMANPVRDEDTSVYLSE